MAQHPITVRTFRADDARPFFEIHRASVREIASSHYPPEVIDAWASPGVITDQLVARFLENPDGEVRLMAELNGQVVGLGVLVPRNSELRACYVAPAAVRRGVGSALVHEIERIAIEAGLDQLNLDASLNAEAFYAALGYEVVQRGEHILRSGQRMASVKMTKRLAKS